jgi:PadR family transcriptional regulator PadR
MNLVNFQAQLRKGILEYCILTILAKRDAYASDIINALKENKLIVVEGTMYPILTRLKNSGYLVYRWEESNQGPPRKYYSLSQLGKKALPELDTSWNELVSMVTSIKAI